MKVQHRKYLYLLFCLMLSIEIEAQVPSDLKDSLVKVLVADGFENVGIYQEKNSIYLFYENRRYRWEIDGLSRVLKEATAALNDSVVLHVVPMHCRVPITNVCIRLKGHENIHLQSSGESTSDAVFSSRLNTDSVRSIGKKIQFYNKSFGRFDLTFLPGLRIQLGNPSQPFEWQVSISPILQTSLWKGSLLSIQAMIPLHNELQYEYEGKIRMETATVNQLFHLPQDIFIYSSAGIFGFTNKNGPQNYFQRYGLTCDIRKYLFNGRFNTGVTAGYTGSMNFSGDYLYYYPDDTKLNYAVFGEYREPRFDFTTRIMAGKFLYDDYAAKLQISRQFHELNLSFFLLKSSLKSQGENGTVGGISISIPIAPKTAFKPGPFRVNLAKYFNFEYRERNVDPIATTYRINPDWNDTFRNLNPDFIEKHLTELR